MATATKNKPTKSTPKAKAPAKPKRARPKAVKPTEPVPYELEVAAEVLDGPLVSVEPDVPSIDHEAARTAPLVALEQTGCDGYPTGRDGRRSARRQRDRFRG